MFFIYNSITKGGKIVHTFKNLPALYEKTKLQGYKHLLIAGWDEHDFDDGFPLYRPSAALGTEEELKKAIADIKADGDHICFYVNSRLCNVGYPQNGDRTKNPGENGYIRLALPKTELALFAIEEM